jgi:hypothetical protein
MLSSADRDHTLDLIKNKQRTFTQPCANPQSIKAGQAGLLFLTYIRNSWMQPDLWYSWSSKGQNDAALVLNINVKGILPTTNHLESFNGVLKRKHITQWQHSGRCLRFDILIYHLIIHILPSIYPQRRMLNSFQSWKTNRFQDAVGGQQLDSHSPQKPKTSIFSPITWYEPDPI